MAALGLPDRRLGQLRQFLRHVAVDLRELLGKVLQAGRTDTCDDTGFGGHHGRRADLRRLHGGHFTHVLAGMASCDALAIDEYVEGSGHDEVDVIVHSTLVNDGGTGLCLQQGHAAGECFGERLVAAQAHVLLAGFARHEGHACGGLEQLTEIVEVAVIHQPLGHHRDALRNVAQFLLALGRGGRGGAQAVLALELDRIALLLDGHGRQRGLAGGRNRLSGGIDRAGQQQRAKRQQGQQRQTGGGGGLDFSAGRLGGLETEGQIGADVASHVAESLEGLLAGWQRRDALWLAGWRDYDIKRESISFASQN